MKPDPVTFRGDDRGSLPMAMLIVSIGMALSAALLPLVVRQVVTTRSFTARAAALNGAQIGLDVVMARVRAAAEVTSSGALARLEDMPGCTVSGDAGITGTGEQLLYEVTITYQDKSGTVLPCSPLTDVPATATLQSKGTGSSGGSRTLTAKYTFSNENDNIPGGAIKIASPADTWCMDAGTTAPAAGTALLMQPCDGRKSQQFGYTQELYLKLIDSEKPANAGFGMCLFATTHAAQSAVEFQKCPDPEDAAPTAVYQWSLDGNSRFRSTSSGTVVENWCMNFKNVGVAGSPVTLNSCTMSQTQYEWRPDSSVGAGMAGEKTSQLGNYAQFSRCLDVPKGDPTWPYMIAWFCKQAPDGKIDWNQTWVHPSPVPPATSKTGTIEVTKNGSTTCLKSPLNTVTNPYVTTAVCGNKTAPELLWTVYHDTGVSATSYRIVDSKGFCLQPSDLNAPVKEVHTDGTSKVKVAICSRSDLQKWNAPPNVNKMSPISDVAEK